MIQFLSDNTPLLLEEFPHFVDIQNIEKFNAELQDEDNIAATDFIETSISIIYIKMLTPTLRGWLVMLRSRIVDQIRVVVDQIQENLEKVTKRIL